MADFYRVNGNAGAIGDGKGWVSTAAGASFIGKEPLALAVVVKGAGSVTDVSNELGVNGAVADILRTISANTTVLAYQVEPVNTGNVSLILEGADGLTASTVASMIRAGGNGAGWYGNGSTIDASATLVSNRGLKISYA